MKLSRSDAIVSACVLVGVVGLLWLFFIDIGSFTLRGDLKPLGTVVFKRMSATRRPSDALGWERVRNDSPVYNADTLRTGGLSEAAIFFDDGTSLELGANSMLRLDFGGPERNLEFLDGEITVGGSASSSSYVISSLAGTITVGADSSATFSRDSEQNVVGVEVNRGTATLVRVDGSTQIVQQNQSLEVNAVDGSSSFVSRPIVPVSPERNARVLVIDEPKVRGLESFALRGESLANAHLVEFSWLLEETGDELSADLLGADSGENAVFSIELSATKNFTGKFLEYPVRGVRASVPVVPGTWYWRVRDASGLLSGVRKFSVSTGTLPRPAFPDDGALYRYRQKLPEIRFAWTAMADANAYIFELSDSRSFETMKMRTRVSLSNLSVSDIGEGTWYWRVSPLHGYTEVQGSVTPVIRSVIVEKSGAMTSLAVSTPFPGHLYQIQELDEKGLAFAWIPHSEAVSYELVVSNTEDFSRSNVVLPSMLPYMRVSGSIAGELAQAGSRYWGVRWIDNEGNKSPLSSARPIVGVDGSIAMRTVFPPNGYKIADSLASNVRFTWKSNVAAPTVFILARDSAFRDIVFQEPVTAETLIGKSWEPGIWYWKIRTLNADNSIFMETLPRSFAIVEPLPEITVRVPIPEKIFYLRDGDSLSLEWNEVSGADYYAVSIYSPKDGYSVPIFEKAHIEGSVIEIPLGLYPSGRYVARIQGFSLESDMSTRVIGYIGESILAYRRLEYLQLASPQNDFVFEGLAALRKGVSLQYQTVNMPETVEFSLLKQNAGALEEVVTSTKVSDIFTAKKLSPGTYLWTVKAKLAGFDISSLETWRFQVMEIPPLPPTYITLPLEGAVFGVKELRLSRTIDFAWKPVPGANKYKISMYEEESQVPRLVVDDLTTTVFVLEDLSVLSRGTNRVQVEARFIEDDGELERSGIPAEGTFFVDLPPAKPIQTKTGSVLYGR